MTGFITKIMISTIEMTPKIWTSRTHNPHLRYFPWSTHPRSHPVLLLFNGAVGPLQLLPGLAQVLVPRSQLAPNLHQPGLGLPVPVWRRADLLLQRLNPCLKLQDFRPLDWERGRGGRENNSTSSANICICVLQYLITILSALTPPCTFSL